MNSERAREAAEYRAKGSQEKQTIQAKADRDVVVLVGEAQQKADTDRGEGDALRNKVFADAYGKDPRLLRLLPFDERLRHRLREPRHAARGQPGQRLLPLLQVAERHHAGAGGEVGRRREPGVGAMNPREAAMTSSIEAGPGGGGRSLS